MIRKGENKGGLESRSDKERYPCVQVGVFVSAHVFLCVSQLGGPLPIGTLSCQTPHTHTHTHACMHNPE